MVSLRSKKILHSRIRLAAHYKKYSIWYGAADLGIGLNTYRRWLDKHKIVRHGKVLNKQKSSARPKTTYSFQLRNGYRYVKRPEWDKAKSEHRVVMEELLGRSILPTESVHHINGKRYDNSPQNLFLFHTHSAHKQSEAALYRIALDLVEIGVIKFKDGIYLLNKRKIRQ